MYRVLLQTKSNDIHIWDYHDLWQAENAYNDLSDYQRVMLMTVDTRNVKLIKEKSCDTVYQLKKRIAAQNQKVRPQRARITKNK
tara:strand:- start:476 stop:727 length:252 start_codon:yes stop_codon:yes gene_type:complete